MAEGSVSTGPSASHKGWQEMKEWPGWLKWLAPHDPGTSGRMLFRCQCGRLMWSDAPQRIRALHEGHQMRLAQSASLWEFAQMKLGLLNRLTRRERLQQRGWL